MPSTHPPALPADRGLLDRVGATGSALCAAHCAALPLVLVLAPTLGAGLANHTFEIGFVAFASLLGLVSLLLGYRRHRTGRAFALLAPGIVLLWLGAWIDAAHLGAGWHALAMALGGSLIAAAHVLNLRLSRSCEVACAC